ncbi:caspase family protein [Chamaesiphon sp. VAR_69_metabat_338]|uniref:caspase family protein n=1 Tax=Chamaesiphon sp. VAR_69_metabat_338 TaxID=2964704 RepID=UPI00286E8C62|nr:caspase family protein [Chamaesiphon sp. VAR_69_metabat_338]
MANQACISIGIDRYQFLPSLSYGVADAVAIEQFFVDAAGWSPHQCLLLTEISREKGNRSTYPTRENIDRWIKQWSWDTLHHGDLLWFFFSGCGVSFGDEDYLIPIDGNTQDLANTCISIRQLYQQFRDIGVNAMVFLDANHAQHLSLGGGIGNNTARFAQEYQIPTFLSCQSHEFSHEDAGLTWFIYHRAVRSTQLSSRSQSRNDRYLSDEPTGGIERTSLETAPDTNGDRADGSLYLPPSLFGHDPIIDFGDSPGRSHLYTTRTAQVWPGR